MKRFSLLLIIYILARATMAQTYEAMWQRANKASADDLPRTALAEVESIRAKAYAEGNDAEFLRATLSALVCGTEISPDTASIYAARLDSALMRENRPIWQSLWHSALAQSLVRRQGSEWDNANLSDKERERLIRSHFKASLHPAEALMREKMTDYLPVFTVGNADNLYQKDLFHILYLAYTESNTLTAEEHTALAHRYAQVYDSLGFREASLLLALDSLTAMPNKPRIKGRLENDERFRHLLALAEKNNDLPLSTAVWAEISDWKDTYTANCPQHLHNDSLLYTLTSQAAARYPKHNETARIKANLARMQQSSAEVSEWKHTFYPAEKVRLKAVARNVSHLSLRLTRIFDSAADAIDANDKLCAQLAKKYRSSAVTADFALRQGLPVYAEQEAEADITVPNEPGVYCAELVADGKVWAQEKFYVSALTAMVFSYAPSHNRVTVIDSRTGHPVAAASVSAYRYGNDGKPHRVRTYTTDTNGTVDIVSPNERRYTQYFAATATDRASSSFSLSDIRYYGRNANNQASTTIDLFADRAIYRPGQKVHFAGVVYTRRGDNTHTEANVKARVDLLNVNGRVVDSLLVKSDEHGSFGGTLSLPAECLPGTFRLRASNKSLAASCHVRVDEYKRPTFTAETEAITEAYTAGDTVAIRGKAATYAGVPVGGARVQYRVERTAWFYRNDDDYSAQSGEVLTDANGAFALPVYLAPFDEDETARRFNRYTYTVSYIVTAENGESTEGSTFLHLATKRAWIEGEVPQTIFRRKSKEIPSLTLRVCNAAGTTLSDTLTYRLLQNDAEVLRGTCRSGVAFTPQAIAALPSDNYTWEFVSATAADTLRAVCSLLSENDCRTADREAPFFVHSESDKASGNVELWFGTARQNVLAYLDLATDTGLVRSERLLLSDTLVHISLPYLSAYGDGAKVCVAATLDGTLHSKTIDIRKPEPDKRLLVRWRTFRSRLTPGQKEEWQLQIVRPDGTAAYARMFATLYDASLDAFAQHEWQLSNLYFPRFLPSIVWDLKRNAYAYHIYGHGYFSTPSYTPLRFAAWKDELFRYSYYGRAYLRYGYRRMYSRAATALYSQKEATEEIVSLDNAEAPAEIESAPAVQAQGIDMSASKMLGTANGTTSNSAATTALRSNFAETAYFSPHLQTDAEGNVSLSFTLPQSMTRWNFRALAFDQAMNYALTDTTAVASKELMVEPALPRFVRQGDETQLPVRVSNLAAKELRVRLHVELVDALDNHTLYNKEQNVSLAPGEVKTVFFPYSATDGSGILICRTMGEADGYADGEERYLPLLTDEAVVTRTIPFSLREKGTLNLRIDTLFTQKQTERRSLAVEISSNPTWYAVSALPALVDASAGQSAVDWATRYYARSIAARIAADQPAIRALAQGNEEEADALVRLQTAGLTDQTPWLQRAETAQSRAKAFQHLFDAETAAAQKYTAIEKLRQLQQSDGSWSWYPGMKGNSQVTVEAAVLLARVQYLTNDRSAEDLLQAALTYLQNDMAENVKEMKQREKQNNTRELPSELALRYLYLRHLLALKPDADSRYLLQRAKEMRKELTMYGKALAAVILADAGYKDEARLSLQSLWEHTVVSPELGRYFDTPRAEWSWHSYRIPTQCAAIEALQYFGLGTPESQMRLWLIQSKRTQMWETSRATADAVFALLSTSMQMGDTTTVMPLTNTKPVYYTLYKGNKIVGLNARSETATPTTAGYFRRNYTEAPATEATSLRVQKTTDGLSWGSVYATEVVSSKDVKTEGKGLVLTSHLEKWDGNEWSPLTSETMLHPGDKVRQTFTIKADRDYDFVSLRAERAACFEPVRPLSGYDACSGIWAYRAVHDNASEYFIEHLRKGTHTLSDEYFTDRAGKYSTGISTVRCVYAPEYCATSESATVVSTE